MRSTEVVSKKRLGENEQTDLGRLQGTGVAASVGGTAPLSGAGALIVDAISQSCHVDVCYMHVSVLGAEDEEQATHCYKASGKSNSSSVSAKPPMSPGRVKTLEDHDQILAAIILAHGQDTCPRSLMILHKILPRFCPRFLAKNITLPKILGQELLAGRCDELIAINTPNPTHLQPPSSNRPPSNVPLPTFNEVCQLNLPTLPFIPTKAKPAFAKALSSTLRAVIETNTEQAWLKLLMLPKCVLPSVKRSGSHTHPAPSSESLCRRWLDNEVESLWSMAKSREVKSKWTCETPSTLYQGGLSWMNVLPSSYPGLFGVTGPTLSSGILKVNYMYALNWQKLAAIIDADDECIDLLFHAWYLDDGVLAGNRLAVSRAFFLIQELGPALGFHINLGKLLPDGSFGSCHPPNLASDALKQFDKAAQLGLRHGGLGLRSLSLHAPAISSGHGCLDNTCLQQAVTLYNAKVSPPDALTVESVLASPPTQKALSSKIDMNLFHGLLENASPANKARLLSESASHAAAWLSVVPSIELGLHLEPYEYQVAVWWWLGLDTSGTAMCPFCPADHHFGAEANGAELRKLNANSTKCTELGWTCIPMAVEIFSHWGREAQSVLSRLASHLSISLSQPRAAVVADIYGRLNIILYKHGDPGIRLDANFCIFYSFTTNHSITIVGHQKFTVTIKRPFEFHPDSDTAAIIGSPQQLLHPCRGRSQDGEPSSSNLLLIPVTLVNQLLQINPVPRPWEPPGSDANNIVL
eukprot:Em0003g1446a